MEYAVIMAGGLGSRFWPKSREARPKQFLTVFGERSLIQHTSDRLDGLIPPERRFVVTNSRYIDETRAQLPDLPPENVLAEPIGRNTAPCIAFAAVALLRQDPDAAMVVLPADHFIRDIPGFQQVLRTALDTCTASDALVTIGIQPTHPATGYGYIQCDPAGVHPAGRPIPVLRFQEKPDLASAEQFVASGAYLWNSGMFVWRSRTIWDAFERHLPEVSRAFAPLFNAATGDADVERAFSETPGISIDHGVMEHADNVYVVPGAFGWSDVGDWRAVYDLSKKDAAGNATQGEVLLDSTQNCLIHAEKRLVAVIGVENLAVIDTGDALLICDLDQTQEIKHVRALIRDRFPDHV
jgi:mannose-1-phosphate guanylyltransferase